MSRRRVVIANAALRAFVDLTLAYLRAVVQLVNAARWLARKGPGA